MKIIGLDLETTGLVHPDHRILEIYMGHWNEKGQLLDEYEQRIDPERAIALDAQRVHGISSSMLIGKPNWARVATPIYDFLADADVIVAHNGKDFDFKFLNQEFKRVSVPPIPSKIHQIDTMVDGRWAMPLGEIPSLQNLCFACGVDYDPEEAHAAAYDVHRMMDCFFKATAWGFFQLPCPAPAEEISNAA